MISLPQNVAQGSEALILYYMSALARRILSTQMVAGYDGCADKTLPKLHLEGPNPLVLMQVCNAWRSSDLMNCSIAPCTQNPNEPH